MTHILSPSTSPVDRNRELIEELRRRPDEQSTSRRSPRAAMWIAAAVAVALGAAGVWYAAHRSAEAPAVARTATAATQAPPTTAAAPLPSASLDASGYIVARRQATVAAKITGRVIDVPIEEGQYVAQGQLLAKLDDSNARAEVAHAAAERSYAQAALASARVALNDARPTFARAEQQFSKGVLSAQQFDTAKAEYNKADEVVSVAEKAAAVAAANLFVAQQNQNDTIIHAPFSGTVTAKAVQPGEVVSPISAGGFTRTGICTLVDMRSLELQVDVSENFISRVRPGQPVVVTLNAYPDWHIPAEVSGILPSADRSKGTVKVRIALNVLDQRILPDMGARASFR
jgi:RND family efflux transporter MFP subunit